MRAKIIVLVLLLAGILAGVGYFLFVFRGKTSPQNIVDFQEFIRLPDSTEVASETTPAEEEEKPQPQAPPPPATSPTPRPAESVESRAPSEITPSQPTLKGTGAGTGTKTESVAVQEEEQPSPEKLLPDVGNLNIDVENISIPEVQTELGGGISVSGTIALEEAYYKQHDLQKAQKLAMDILKQNPNDPTAKKILKLIEYESKGNQALMRGDYSTALQYFQKMQEIDPNNKWAKKGIIRAQSGG